MNPAPKPDHHARIVASQSHDQTSAPTLHAITTSSSHLLFAGAFERACSAVCDPSVQYYKKLTFVEDKIGQGETAFAIDVAFQLAKDYAFFNEIMRTHPPPNVPNETEASARVAMAFGTACAKAKMQDRIVVVTSDSGLVKEMHKHKEIESVPEGIVHIIDAAAQLRNTAQLPSSSSEQPMEAESHE